MMEDWNQLLTELRKAGPRLKAANPKAALGYFGLRDSQHSGATLDGKTRELIALAVAATTHCDGCIASHVTAAHKEGATIQEVGEALGVAIALNAGSAYVYALRVLEAFEQASTASPPA